MIVLSLCAVIHAADPELPDAKPVPDMQVIPHPYDQASFEFQGKELTRYHFGPTLRHPFWYPIIGPGGRSMTRMNMPWDPARWCDYSGPVTPEESGGITLIDHPKNPTHPSKFHVRNNGWMGVCLTRDAARVIEPGKPLRLRYALWVHSKVPDQATVERQWQSFAKRELAALKVQHPE